MKLIKNLILTLTISLHAFSVITMAQSVEINNLNIVASITDKVKPGLRMQSLEGSTQLSENVFIQKGDYFILSFDKSNGQSANELIMFDKLPTLKMVHKGKTLVENEDFTRSLHEGKLEVYFNTIINGQITINISDFEVSGSHQIVDRVYYMVLEEHFSNLDRKIEIQQVPINYSNFSTLGGTITFTADSPNCEMDRKTYTMNAQTYINDTTGKLMVPLKDTLKLLGTTDNHMIYNKGIFEAYVGEKYIFTVNSNTVIQIDTQTQTTQLSQPIIINEGTMYIALEDLATILNAEIKKSFEHNEIQTFYLPVSRWIED